VKKSHLSPRSTRTRRALLEALENRTFMHAGHAVEPGTGLLAQYFDNKDFTALKLTRADAKVDFNWAGASPASGIGADTFSVRWTGQLIPTVDGNYTFSTTTDDGVRLWVSGNLVIDKLINQAAKTYNSTPITLAHGEAVDIRMDYFDNTGQAKAQLMWTTPAMAKQIIPMNQSSGCHFASDERYDSSRPVMRGTTQYIAPMYESAAALPTVVWKCPWIHAVLWTTELSAYAAFTAPPNPPTRKSSIA
jgi:hypothetical protein